MIARGSKDDCQSIGDNHQSRLPPPGERTVAPPLEDIENT
jgi:hypothetical protein